MLSVTIVIRTIMLLAAATLTACGGGGAPAPPAGGGSGWQQGVFLSASTFQNQCQNPRSGVGVNGQPFPDMQGQTLDENNFLRSYSDETYLWYDEIIDQNPAGFSDPFSYFDQLRTFADSSTAAAGDCLAGFNRVPRDLSRCKDKFHFTVDSEEWFQLSQSGVSVNYGATWSILASLPPREVVVAYTEMNTSATDPAVALSRGARLVSIDNEPVIDGKPNILNAGLFPTDVGETHSFEIQDLGSLTTRTVLVTADTFPSDPVQNVSVINTTAGDAVGYMLFNAHRAPAEAELIAAINQLQGVDDLVLDIRYNGGGFLDIASELAYMIADPGLTAGQTFEGIRFNNKLPSSDPLLFHTTTQGFSAPPGPLPTLNLNTVYVITGPNTCSASEAIMNGLRGVNVNVIQIGSTTCGKPYGFFEQPNCGTSYFTIQFRGVNAMNFGDYTDGFSPENTDPQGIVGVTVPGCSVADDFTAQLGDPTEGRLAAALMYRATQTCPLPPSGVAQPGSSKPGAPLSATDGIISRSPWDSNRIYRQ